MPCSVSPEEIEYYAREQRKAWEKQGRWDKLATKEQLAGWLCDSMRGNQPTPEAVRWFEAHKKFADKEEQWEPPV